MSTVHWVVTFRDVPDYIEKQDEKTVKILLEGKVNFDILPSSLLKDALKITGGLIAYRHCFWFLVHLSFLCRPRRTP